jgi:hypothetical protein
VEILGSLNSKGQITSVSSCLKSSNAQREPRHHPILRTHRRSVIARQLILKSSWTIGQQRSSQPHLKSLPIFEKDSILPPAHQVIWSSFEGGIIGPTATEASSLLHNVGKSRCSMSSPLVKSLICVSDFSILIDRGVFRYPIQPVPYQGSVDTFILFQAVQKRHHQQNVFRRNFVRVLQKPSL